MKSISKTIVIVLYFISFFVLDFFNKKQINASEQLLFAIKTTKTFFYILFIVILLYERNLGFLKKAALPIALVAGHQSLLMMHQYDLVVTTGAKTIRELSLYCFPIVFLSYMSTISSKKDKALLAVFYEVIIIVVVVSTFAGFLFSIPYFRTYSQRFGYLGVLPRSITATYFYISAIIYTYHFRDKSTWLKILFFLTLFGSLLVGTKSIYLFLLLFIIYLFFVNKWYLKKTFYGSILFFIVLFWIFGTTIILALRKVFFTLENVYKKNGLLSAISSYRNDIFFELSKKYEPTWEWYNYLIGGRISSLPTYEMTIIDLIVSFGFIGMAFYLYIVYSLSSCKPPNQCCFINFSLCSVFIISIFAGQFFVNISAISYVVLSLFLVNRSISSNHKNEL
jgi:hypothetical protein